MAKNTPASLADRNAKRAHWKATVDPNSIPKAIVRLCRDCGESRPCEWNYTFTQTGKPEYRTRCTDCFTRHYKSQRKANRKQITRTVKDWRIERKRKCVEILGGKCASCGYSKSIRALTFHHRDVATKVDDIARMLIQRSWEVVLVELEKCDLLCFNCHMEEEERLGLVGKPAVESEWE